jgi:hypothetical protein
MRCEALDYTKFAASWGNICKGGCKSEESGENKEK